MRFFGSFLIAANHENAHERKKTPNESSDSTHSRTVLNITLIAFLLHFMQFMFGCSIIPLNIIVFVYFVARKKRERKIKH
jgi:hypothetical protein